MPNILCPVILYLVILYHLLFFCLDMPFQARVRINMDAWLVLKDGKNILRQRLNKNLKLLSFFFKKKLSLSTILTMTILSK